MFCVSSSDLHNTTHMEASLTQQQTYYGMLFSVSSLSCWCEMNEEGYDDMRVVIQLVCVHFVGKIKFRGLKEKSDHKVSDVTLNEEATHTHTHNLLHTWFYIQGARVDLDVQVLGGSGAELLQDAPDGLCDVVRNNLSKLHPAVDDHAALSEVQDLQIPEARQVGLQVRQQLETAEWNHMTDSWDTQCTRDIEIHMNDQESNFMCYPTR